MPGLSSHLIAATTGISSRYVSNSGLRRAPYAVFFVQRSTPMASASGFYMGSAPPRQSMKSHNATMADRSSRSMSVIGIRAVCACRSATCPNGFPGTGATMCP